MTEQEWLASTDLRQMLEHLGGRISDRKLRLWCAACAFMWSREVHDRNYASWARGEPDAIGWLRGTANAWADSRGLSYLSPAVRAALLREIVGNPFRSVVLPGKPLVCDVLCGGKRCGGRYLPLRKDWGTLSACEKCRAEGPFWAQVLEGNSCPWLTWNDGAVRKIAKSIWDSQRWEEMPILADALCDAGCEDEVILRHLRATSLHVRGCWALDLLLGKE